MSHVWPKWIKFVCELLSHVRLFATLCTAGLQAPLSMEFSRQEYWSGLPFPSPGDLPDLEIEPKPESTFTSYFPSQMTNLNWAKWVQNNFHPVFLKRRVVRGMTLYVSTHIKVFGFLYEWMCSVYCRILSSTKNIHFLFQDCSTEHTVLSQLQLKLYFPVKL